MVLADGRPGVIVVLDDITDRISVETALERSEAMFHRLVETVARLYLVGGRKLDHTLHQPADHRHMRRYTP